MVHSFLSIFTIILNFYKWDLEIWLSTSGVKVHYSFSSVCVVNCMSTKNIKNTTCVKTVIIASCGTFIGSFVPSSSFIMHFLLTCITIKITVLTTCMLILMFMLMLQYCMVKNCPLQVSILDSCVNGESRTSFWELHWGLSLARLDKTQKIHPWLISQQFYMYIDTTQNGTKWHGLFLQVQPYAYTLIL